MIFSNSFVIGSTVFSSAADNPDFYEKQGVFIEEKDCQDIVVGYNRIYTLTNSRPFSPSKVLIFSNDNLTYIRERTFDNLDNSAQRGFVDENSNLVLIYFDSVGDKTKVSLSILKEDSL